MRTPIITRPVGFVRSDRKGAGRTAYGEYFELDLPVAPAVMVGDEIVVEGSDVAERKLEEVIGRQLGLPAPEHWEDPSFVNLCQ